MKGFLVFISVMMGLSGLGWARYYSMPPPPPILSSVTPNTIIAGSRDTGLSLVGSNFHSNAEAMLNTTQPLATSFVSSTALRAIIPAANLTSPRTASVLVAQATGSNQSVSKSLTITIAPPAVPTLVSMSPAHAIAGSASFTLTVTGTNFSSGSGIVFNSTPLTTTFVNSTTLSATVPSTLISAAGLNNVVVATSGVSTGVLGFRVIAPLVIITASLPAGTVGVGFTWQLAASGGITPYSWAVTAGTLPAGLTLSTAGVINGIPTAAGTSTFTVTVTDSTGTIARKDFKFSKVVSGK